MSRKGCLADQSAANQIICASPSNPLCSSCSSRDNCNIETVRKDENCIVCNSALNANCAQRPSTLQVEHCPTPSDGQCFAKIASGATVRGCRGQLSSSESSACRNNTASSQCAITAGEGSNYRILPENRRKCFHCDSRVDGSCEDKQTNLTLTLPCKKFFQPENCLKLKLSDGAGELKFISLIFLINEFSFLFSYSRMYCRLQLRYLRRCDVREMRRQGWMQRQSRLHREHQLILPDCHVPRRHRQVELIYLWNKTFVILNRCLSNLI